MIHLLLAIALAFQSPAIAPVQSPQNASLTGRVLNEQGEPVAGATVGLREHVADAEQLKIVTTDAQGNYEFSDLSKTAIAWKTDRLPTGIWINPSAAISEHDPTTS